MIIDVDYYSFGITLYEMLVGVPPFQSTDTLELIHSHLAENPKELHSLNSFIPATVSMIVLKLIAKSAEDRYQSMHGFIADIQKSLDLLDTTGTVPHFDLGVEDFSSRFFVSQKIIGRDNELQIIKDTYERILNGNKEIVVFNGSEGLGKTALVLEIQKIILKKSGSFISCRFEQRKRTSPYEELAGAFRQLILQILTLSDVELDIWRSKFLEALGPNSRIIINIIPELKLIIGPQPTPPELEPEQTQNRFFSVFQEFIKVFLTNGYPIVLFIDDLFRADLSTLALINQLLSNYNIKHFLFIASNRYDEISQSSKIKNMIKEMDSKNIPINEIELTPLQQNSVTKIISNTLGCTLANADSLSKICMEKTYGNPYYINQFLNYLFDEGLLKYEKNRNKWLWEIDKINNISASKNVIDLLTDKILKLSSNALTITKNAACIGNIFDVKTLSLISLVDKKELAELLKMIAEEGIIIHVENNNDQNSGDEESQEYFAFINERIHSKAYSLLTEKAKKEIHLEIGRKILSESLEKLEDNLFDILNHIIKAYDLIDDEDEKNRFATICLSAGKVQRESAIYDEAYESFKIGLALLNELSWDTHYELTLHLHEECAESAYLNHNYKYSEELAELIKIKSKSIFDKVCITEILIQANLIQVHRAEAIKIALEMFEQLGITFDENPNMLKILFSVYKTKIQLSKKSINNLENLPIMTDTRMLAFMKIFLKISPALYLENQNLSILIVCKAINVSLKYGNTSASSYSYLAFGIVLGTGFNDLNSNIKYGRIAIALLSKFDTKSIEARINVIYNSFTRLWQDHPKDILPNLLNAYKQGIQTGDFEFAEYAYELYSLTSFFMGRNLATLDAEISSFIDAMTIYLEDKAIRENKLYRQVVENLLEDSKTPYEIKGKYFDETTLLNTDSPEELLLANLFLNKLILAYIFGEYSKAVEFAEQCSKYSNAISGQYHIPILRLYESLSMCKFYEGTELSNRKKYLKTISKNLDFLKTISKLASTAYQNKYCLVEAEFNRIKGKNGKAIEFYEQSINISRENGYINEEAIANELFSEFYSKMKNEKLAKFFIGEAYNCYSEWGAKVKLLQLEQRYPKLFDDDITQTKVTSVSTHRTSEEQLDFLSLLKAARTISGEIVKRKIV